jgi:outer membrane lipoprotein-sorting protein
MKAVNQRRWWLVAHLAGLLTLNPLLAAPDLFADIYARGMVKQRTMKSLRARFTETTTSSLLMKPLVAHGTVVAAAPARMVMTYTDPEAKTLTVDGKTLSVNWPDRQERQQINITDIQKRIDHYFTHASVDELRSMFEIAARPDPKLHRVDLIEMTPKRRQIRDGLDRLELWIDRDNDLLVQMRMTFPGGDQKTVALEDLTLNVPVTDAMFRAK